MRVGVPPISHEKFVAVLNPVEGGEVRSRVKIRPRVQGFGRLLLLGGVAVLASGMMSGTGRGAMRAETLEAIRAVENPRNTTRPGKHGELGVYQFRRVTWRMHTDMPFERALDREAAEDVAVKHYEWVKRGLVRNGLAATPYNIALAWNGGLSAAVRGRASKAAHNYAERVNNLVMERAQRVATAQ